AGDRRQSLELGCSNEILEPLDLPPGECDLTLDAVRPATAVEASTLRLDAQRRIARSRPTKFEADPGCVLLDCFPDPQFERSEPNWSSPSSGRIQTLDGSDQVCGQATRAFPNEYEALWILHVLEQDA